MKRFAIFALLILAAASAWAQGITLIGPDGPIDPKDYAQVQVQGLSDDALPAARVEWTPTAGVTLIPAKTWGGQPFLWFSARNPGKYTITVTCNGWRTSLDRALSEAKSARIDPDLLARLSTLSEEVILRYPVTSGSCVVEVSGTQPDPTPPPVPPPTPGVRRIIMLYETGDQTAELGALQIRLRQSPYLKEKKHSLLILDQNGLEAGTTNVHPVVAQALKDRGQTPLPAILVYDAAGSFVGVAECPKTVDEVIAFVKQKGG